jgi:hypothetical protein
MVISKVSATAASLLREQCFASYALVFLMCTVPKRAHRHFAKFGHGRARFKPHCRRIDHHRLLLTVML